MRQNNTEFPRIVSHQEWRIARKELLIQEKELMRMRDKVNARRRRMPMTEIKKEYLFEGPDGKTSLANLFRGHRQLLLYHFMFGPNADKGCVGCSMLVDNMGHPAHLEARGVSRVLVSRAPLEKLKAYKQKMSWTIPWYSSYGSEFNYDFGVTTDKGETFGLSVFLRDGDRIFRSYFTDKRGVEYLGSNWSYLDLTPFGRQEKWEDSPEEVPQGPPYVWWRHHDEYND